MIEVRVSYVFAGGWPTMDEAAHNAVGRVSDFSGAGFGERDLGWVCQSEIEAERISRSLRQIGMRPAIRRTRAATT